MPNCRFSIGLGHHWSWSSLVLVIIGLGHHLCSNIDTLLPDNFACNQGHSGHSGQSGHSFAFLHHLHFNIEIENREIKHSNKLFFLYLSGFLVLWIGKLSLLNLIYLFPHGDRLLIRWQMDHGSISFFVLTSNLRKKNPQR